jgi:virginiamycin B lyase
VARLAAARYQPYAVCYLRFDPIKEKFDVFPLPSAGANVRQILGRPGEIWGAESGVHKLVVIRTD